jgi:hypothetical protein
MIAVILALVLFVLVLATLLFYLSVRLRFALFDCLIHLTRQISPGWLRYRAQAHMILRDFMLPHIALEDASVGQAWAAVHARISREKGAFLLYAALRIFIPLAAMVALVIVLAIPCLIVFGGFAVALAALHAAFTGAAGLTLILGAFVQILVGLIIMTAALFVAISFGGPLCIAIRNYALLFYGGRYQALGDILWPSSPAVEPGTA